MDEEISVPVSLPLDADGFLRRECPSCERQFKWFNHEEGAVDAEPVNQYFCPLCGVPADTGAWWTPEQLEYAQAVAAPEMERAVQDVVSDAFKGIKGIKYKPGRDFSLGIDTPDPLIEPDDMVILEPPCHPSEPVKVPEESVGEVHCLICGSPFTA